jgi:hypothetical protein
MSIKGKDSLKRDRPGQAPHPGPACSRINGCLVHWESEGCLTGMISMNLAEHLNRSTWFASPLYTFFCTVLEKQPSIGILW